jgi:hypothetical protein
MHEIVQSGAQIGISLVVGGLAWVALWCALRPFGLLVIGRSDVAKASGYGFLSLCLFGLSRWIWMLGG